MKLTSRKQFAQASLALMAGKPADPAPSSLYSLARQVKDDVQGALDYLAPGPRQDEERARKLLLQAADRIALSGEVGL